MTPNPTNLRLGAQYDQALNDRLPIRIYLTDEGKTHYRCHLAIPEALFRLELYAYPKRFTKWWKKEDGFYLFDTMITRPNTVAISPDELTVSLRALLLRLMKVIVMQTSLA